MRRLHRVLVTCSFAAIIAAPAVAHAQPGNRPATQLFLMPTGRTLPKGHAYLKGVGLGMPIVQGGVTDRFSIGIGTPILPLGEGLVMCVLVTPKFQVQRSDTHSTSVGVIEALTSEGSGGVAYVAHTVELSRGAIHVTAMSPLLHGIGARAILLMVGGERYINDHVTFMTENYIAAGGLPMISGGVRLKAPHTTWDLGLMVPVGLGFGMRPAPMISGGWKF